MSVTKVVLAKLSPTMEEGTIVKWNKSEGDQIKIGDVLAEIETDKANMEMEALGAGVLRKILVPAGGKAPVGSLIGVIANPDEDVSALLAAAPAPSAPAAKEEQAAPPRSASPSPAKEPPPAPAPIPAEPFAHSSGNGSRLKASPLARSIAARQNIPLNSVPGADPVDAS